MDLFARTDVTFTSKQYADALNLAYTPGRYNVNASVGVSGENWSVTGWVENLLDDTYTTNSFYIVQFLRYAPSINEGIRGGVTLSYRF
jgi:outer membrane receptor protein involved in Fe transport